jgi:hypothetical protein
MSGYLLNLQHQHFGQLSVLPLRVGLREVVCYCYSLRRVPVYLFVVCLITPSVSLVLRRVMNRVRFDVPAAVLGRIRVLGCTLYRLLKGSPTFEGL